MKPAVVFDLDGTLVNSLPDIIASFKYVLRKAGLAPPSENDMADLIGLPLAEMFRRAAPGASASSLSEAYRRHYRAHMTDNSRTYPGVPEALGELRERGLYLIVASTKRSHTARSLASAVGLLPLLDHIQGTDFIPAKPAPDVIYAALNHIGGKGICMVGDTTHDVLAGKAAGLCTYAVGWGAHPPETLRSSRPDFIGPDLKYLLKVLSVMPV